MHLSGKEINSLWNTNNLFAVAKKLGAKDVNRRDHIKVCGRLLPHLVAVLLIMLRILFSRSPGK